MGDIELDDEDMKAAGGSTFSPAAIGLMVILVGVGILFGWAAATSVQNRGLYSARSQDAARIHEALQPKVANLDKAKTLVGKLDPAKPDFELNKKLADLDVAPGGNLLGGNHLLLGSAIINNVTNYTLDASMLEQMLDRHKRQTKADKKELKSLVEGNDVVKQNKFAVLFDYSHLSHNSGKDNYVPKQGKLVTVSSLEKDDDGKIEVKFLNSDRTAKTKIQGILPLPKGDIIKSGGQNALQRYRTRIGDIQRQLKKFKRYRSQMMSQLDKLANRPSAPLISL